ncbi:MAG TPA: NfeD family protein [Acidimicrobiales bacterium]|nr:NfeD family protein [Acidimicrobiales bacterium]
MELAWLVGGVVATTLVISVVAAAHAGGHHFAVPVPGIGLGLAWLAVTLNDGASALSWTLAALCLLTAAGATAIAVPAWRAHAALSATAPDPLKGAEGVALSDLRPAGTVRVGGETWSAESLSGDLPAGATVHVASRQGLRLRVWSDAGLVGGLDQIGSGEERR